MTLHSTVRTLVSLICLVVAGTATAENTPLHDAAGDGNVATIEALLAGGANVNAKNKFTSPALHWAADNGDVAAIEALLAAGANVSAKDETGITALHRAAFRGHSAAIEALLVAGANVNAELKDGKTSLDAAYEGMEATEGSIVPFQESIEILKARAGRGDRD